MLSRDVIHKFHHPKLPFPSEKLIFVVWRSLVNVDSTWQLETPANEHLGSSEIYEGVCLEVELISDQVLSQQHVQNGLRNKDAGKSVEKEADMEEGGDV